MFTPTPLSTAYLKVSFDFPKQMEFCSIQLHTYSKDLAPGIKKEMTCAQTEHMFTVTCEQGSCAD